MGFAGAPNRGHAIAVTGPRPAQTLYVGDDSQRGRADFSFTLTTADKVTSVGCGTGSRYYKEVRFNKPALGVVAPIMTYVTVASVIDPEIIAVGSPCTPATTINPQSTTRTARTGTITLENQYGRNFGFSLLFLTTASCILQTGSFTASVVF